MPDDAHKLPIWLLSPEDPNDGNLLPLSDPRHQVLSGATREAQEAMPGSTRNCCKLCPLPL